MKCPILLPAMILVAASFGTAAGAPLLNFGFAFSGDSFRGDAGTVTGEIDGLTDNATSTPSQIIITSSTLAGYTYPLVFTSADFVPSFPEVFTLADGSITDANIIENQFIGGSSAEFLIIPNGVTFGNGGTGPIVSNSAGLSSIQFTPLGVAVNEPAVPTATAALFLTLLVLSRRRNS